ncbi:hypothetical protein HCTV-16_gp34 [Haloarcula virus HCTV-16]|nr:hypothetical protein HCTV-16_gp34 [Haloarcula virus HCTV-16]
MSLEAFEYEGDDETMPSDMDGWFEVFDTDEEKAWVASDTTVEVRR